MKKYIATVFNYFIRLCAVYSVNTACNLVYGQEQEPISLQRLKKTNSMK